MVLLRKEILDHPVPLLAMVWIILNSIVSVDSAELAGSINSLAQCFWLHDSTILRSINRYPLAVWPSGFRFGR